MLRGDIVSVRVRKQTACRGNRSPKVFLSISHGMLGTEVGKEMASQGAQASPR